MARPAILLVDDEPTILTSLKSQLRGLYGSRFTYELAASAPEAWEILEELHSEGVRVVVVVSDWLMPEVRGDVFLARVQQQFPDIVRIMLTGHAEAAAVDRAHHEARVTRVLHKPWSSADLKGAIEEGLST